jgi:hypothetical protein
MSVQQIRPGNGNTNGLWKMSHQTCSQTGISSRYVHVTRSTALPSAWSGSETFCEFELPQTLGITPELIVRFQVTVATATATLPPTPFWISRVEEFVGNDQIATTYSNELWNEGVGFLTPAKLDQLNEALNTTTSYGNGVVPVGTSYYYLPLSATSFATMSPYVKGFSAKLRVRLYFPSSIVASGSGTVSLSDVILIAKELITSPARERQIADAHGRGVVDYNVIVRERQQENTSLTAGTDSAFFLRAFKNDSAGLLVYLTNQAPTNATLIDRVPVESIQLQDQLGNKISEVLRTDFNRPFIWSDNIDSAFTASSGANNNVSLIPFSTNFQTTATNGCEFGSYPMTTLEKLIVRPSDASTNFVGNKTLNVVSYSYGHVVCDKGKHTVHMTSTSSR